MNSFLIVKNNSHAALSQIPVLSYNAFYDEARGLLRQAGNHCVTYHAFLYGDKLKFICCVARDESHDIAVLSHETGRGEAGTTQIMSLTKEIPAMHVFEREIYENFGVFFEDHPWLKPLRFSYNRYNQKQKVSDYPFYEIQSDQLHEVGVGPIHAGIIEPGHFRFICNGEKVLHLEIQLGWQHRGIEDLFLKKSTWLQRNLLSESIAGDTAIGHSLAFVGATETLAGLNIPGRLATERCIALELERIAIHTADMGALCTDIAYQLGAAVFGVLRTPIINFMQRWCGNRLGKGMIRVGGSHYPLTPELRKELKAVLKNYKEHFLDMAHLSYHLVSLQNRFDNIGVLSKSQVQDIGAVGMAAKMAGLPRDIRQSHPFMAYHEWNFEPIVLEAGDVFARFLLRSKEIQQSLALIEKVIDDSVYPSEKLPNPQADTALKLEPEAFAISLTEGWRGEICHMAVTDSKGNLLHYKIKDPSMHNWMALALSLRDLEISDFPINNKSYNLSYAGHDL